MSKVNKRIFSVLLIIIGLVAIGFASYFLLVNQPKPASKLDPKSAKETIELLSKSSTITGLDTGFTGAKAGDIPFYYQPDDKKYAVESRVSNNYVYVGNSKDQTDDSADIRLTILNVFAGMGFSHTVDGVFYNYGADVYDTFEKDGFVCQSSIMTTNPYEKQTYRFACEDAATLAARFKDTDALLALYRTSNTLDTFGVAQLTENTDKKVSYAILYVGDITISETESKTLTLLFAAVDDNWEYLGKLLPPKAGSGGVVTARYDLTNVKTKIAQAKYGTFITDSLSTF